MCTAWSGRNECLMNFDRNRVYTTTILSVRMCHLLNVFYVLFCNKSLCHIDRINYRFKELTSLSAHSNTVHKIDELRMNYLRCHYPKNNYRESIVRIDCSIFIDCTESNNLHIITIDTDYNNFISGHRILSLVIEIQGNYFWL